MGACGGCLCVGVCSGEGRVCSERRGDEEVANASSVSQRTCRRRRCGRSRAEGVSKVSRQAFGMGRSDIMIDRKEYLYVS